MKKSDFEKLRKTGYTLDLDTKRKTGYQLIGFYKSLKVEDCNKSDGFIFDSREKAARYALKNMHPYFFIREIYEPTEIFYKED